MSQAPAPPRPMTPYTPSHPRFLAAILLGSLASGAVWIVTLDTLQGSQPLLHDAVALQVLLSAISMLLLTAIGWPLFALFRRTSHISFRVATGLGLSCGLAIGACSMQPLYGAWVAACSLAGATAAAVSWWWVYRPASEPPQ